MNLTEIYVYGNFGCGENLLNGQTIKTKTVTKELENAYGNNSVLKIDTRGGIRMKSVA